MLGYIISDKEKINVEEHEIKSFDILHKIDLNIFIVKNNEILSLTIFDYDYELGLLFENNFENIASKYGYVQLLEWFKKSGNFYQNINCMRIISCKYGHIQILEFLKYYDIVYCDLLYYIACKYGQIQILEWFKNNNISFENIFKKGEYVVSASINNHISVLKWLKKNNKLIYQNILLFLLKNINVLNFFFENINIKKIIIFSHTKFIETIKLKTKNNYIKGYNKN
jgi:hypothetical protein